MSFRTPVRSITFALKKGFEEAKRWLRIAKFSMEVMVLPRPRVRICFLIDRVNSVKVEEHEVTRVEMEGSVVTISGWAIDDIKNVPASEVIVSVDGVEYRSKCEIERGDVAKAFRSASYLRSGFEISLPASNVCSGEHALTIRAVDTRGHAIRVPSPVWRVEIVEPAGGHADIDSQPEKDRRQAKRTSRRSSPTISIIMLSSDGLKPVNKRLMESVLRQSYSLWELIIDEHALTRLDRVALDAILVHDDPRVKIIGVSKSKTRTSFFESAINKARGEYAVLLPESDGLSDDTLAHVASFVGDGGKPDILIGVSVPSVETVRRSVRSRILEHRKSKYELLHGFSQLVVFKKKLLKRFVREMSSPTKCSFGEFVYWIDERINEFNVHWIDEPRYTSKCVAGMTVADIQETKGSESVDRRLVVVRAVTPLRVAVDGRTLHRPMDGTGRYVRELMRAMSPWALSGQIEVALLVQKRPDFAIPGIRPFERDHEETIQNCDVFHKTLLVDHLSQVNEMLLGKACVYTVPDLILFSRPDYFPDVRQFQAYRKLSVITAHLADHVLAISLHGRKEVEQFLGVDRINITVTHLAAVREFDQEQDAMFDAKLRDEYGLPARYLLFVGADYPHKNLARLLRSYDRARERIPGIGVVIVGPSIYWRFQPDIEEAFDRLSTDVVRLGHFPEAYLPALYANAVGLVYPSLSEGFGLPPLEAMKFGIPVLASNATSIPEVVGKDAALLIDATNESEMEHGLIKLCMDEPMRQRLIAAGLRRVRQFTWEKTASETVKSYHAAYNKSRTEGTLTRKTRQQQWLAHFDSPDPIVLNVPVPEKTEIV